MTQTEQIIRDLRKGHKITPIDALNRYQCFRLAARIFDLRREGWDIRDRIRNLESGKQCAEYWLPKECR